MKTSPLGVAFIANEEGWRPGLTDRVYADFAGRRTIGYGHLVARDEHFHEPMTHDEALALLARDLGGAERTVRRWVRQAVNQNEFDALVSLVFNIGAGHFATSTVLRLLNEGDREGAADAFLMWNKATIGGKFQVSAVLDRRRRRERDAFLKPAG